MSVSRGIVEIICDGRLTGGNCPNNRAWTDYGPATDLRGRMRRDGWDVALPGGKDRCPDCRTRRPA